MAIGLCLQYGTLGSLPSPTYQPNIRWFDCNAATDGGFVVLSDPDHAALIPVGAVIFVRERDYYYNGENGQIPLHLVANTRVAAREPSLPSGAIQLGFWLTRPIEAPQIAVFPRPS